MPFIPFDGVLLDDPREPVPGVAAIQLHHRVERDIARQDRRRALSPEALRARASACRLLLNQGLGPGAVRALKAHGLDLGRAQDPRSLASLVRHLEAYLGAVDAAGYLEPAAALWAASERQQGGQPGFWVERQPEDGPLICGLPDLAPVRLRALCALPELGDVRFRIPTSRGAGRHGLFERPEPHLVKQLLPGLEALAATGAVDHLNLEAPEGWGENAWGDALDGLFQGPLDLDAAGRSALRRAALPTEPAVWRAAVEQVCAWVAQGVAPQDITLIHPEPERAGPFLRTWLEAEGIPVHSAAPSSLLDGPVWGPLFAILRGLADQDPARLAAGLGACAPGGDFGASLQALAGLLDLADQAGPDLLGEAIRRLPADLQALATSRLRSLSGLAEGRRTMAGWLKELEALAQRLGLIGDGEAFYPALGLLAGVWGADAQPAGLREGLDMLESGLRVSVAPEAPPRISGVRLLAPSGLEASWPGAEATLALDLGEGAWPRLPSPSPDLDHARQWALNQALRRMSLAGEGCPDFPPALQTFPLPQAEAGEVLPRAFHRDAFGFTCALALTRRYFVALSSERDGEGRLRGQGPFWTALEGAGDWAPEPSAAASALRCRWEAPRPDALTSARQQAVALGIPGPATTLARAVPAEDRVDWVGLKGDSAERPVSPTFLQALATCPFRAWVDRGLGLPVWTEDGGTLLRTGQLAHALVEALLAGLEGAPHWPEALRDRHGLGDFSEASLLGCLRDLWEARAEAWLSEGPPLDASQAIRLRLALEASLPALAAVLRADALQARPTEAEVAAFGLPEGPWTRQILGLEVGLEPRALPLEPPLWVSGKVDRLERWTCGERAFLRIIDYKQSSASALKAYPEDDGLVGAHLQLPLYQWLVESVHAMPVSAVLLSLREAGVVLPMMIPPEDGDAQERLFSHIGAFMARARRGEVPALPGAHCRGCALSALCGRPVDLEALVDAEAE